MARHHLSVKELNHEHSVGNLRQMVLALAGVPDDAFYSVNATLSGRVTAVEVRWDDQGVPVAPETLPMRAVRMEAKDSGVVDHEGQQWTEEKARKEAGV